MKLRTVSIIGDGNCFFRSISMCIYGDQSQHKELRNNVANHVLASGKEIFTHVKDIILGDESIRKSADAIRVDCSWVGEDAILATADYLKRNISIFLSSTIVSPITYYPSSCTSVRPPVRVAFYEPEHYAAVVDSKFALMPDSAIHGSLN